MFSFRWILDMADITDFFSEFGQDFHLRDVIYIKYLLQDSLTGKFMVDFPLVASYVTPDKNGIFFM